jgi:uncharacterized protein YjiS (DUF1127 family)
MAYASDILSARTAGTQQGVLARTLGYFQQWREFSKTRNELAALSDRNLADLGISRGEITAIARRSVYGADY